ncbi:hypothetical protein OSTOST_15919 [Ostertagia ostertagi]
MTERTAQRWFARFRSGEFELHDHTPPGRTSEFDHERLQELVQEDSRQSTRELGQQIGCSKATVSRQLRWMGKSQKFGAWVPHLLERSRQASTLLHCRLSACAQRFLYRIVTGDEKWCLYLNRKHRKEWVSPNKQATPRNNSELKVWLDDFFETRPEGFYRRGFEKLVHRWEEVVNNEGEYITE